MRDSEVSANALSRQLQKMAQFATPCKHDPAPLFPAYCRILVVCSHRSNGSQTRGGCVTMTSAPSSTFFRTRSTPASSASIMGFATAQKANRSGRWPLRVCREHWEEAGVGCRGKVRGRRARFDQGYHTASSRMVTRRRDSRQDEFPTAFRWPYHPTASTRVRFTAEYKPHLSRMLVARRSSSYTSGRKRLTNGRRRAGWLPDT